MCSYKKKMEKIQYFFTEFEEKLEFLFKLSYFSC